MQQKYTIFAHRQVDNCASESDYVCEQLSMAGQFSRGERNNGTLVLLRKNGIVDTIR